MTERVIMIVVVVVVVDVDAGGGGRVTVDAGRVMVEAAGHVFAGVLVDVPIVNVVTVVELEVDVAAAAHHEHAELILDELPRQLLTYAGRPVVVVFNDAVSVVNSPSSQSTALWTDWTG